VIALMIESFNFDIESADKYHHRITLGSIVFVVVTGITFNLACD